MTSTHTSLEAARAPARLPWAALLQMPSTLAFTVAESVGSFSTTALQIATYSATPALAAAPVAALGVVAGDVDVVAVVAGLRAADVEVVAGVLAAVELLVVELTLLPHPAASAPQSSTARNTGDRLPIIGAP
jgi:hypothetical protein